MVDSQGNILFNSSDSSIGQRAANAHYTTLPDFDPTSFGNTYYTVGNFYDSFSENTITVFSPVTANYRVRSYVLIHKPVATVTEVTNHFMNITFFTVGIIYICAFLILLFFTICFYRPMLKMNSVAKSYAKGNFEPRISLHSNDEIGFLANTMNYMANELNTLEEDQRKFISNVSHDFRSPLTSIKGYVEAMLDGTIPPELQDKYLNIILFETERLAKLTQSILDLNQFGRHGIKFSHNNSAIKIETSIKNEKVLISVKDSGIGIPADSIKKIWDRFYKTDLSRGKDKKGTGLGLAIVKEIIQAHNEHINVISTEGVGTEFIFTLPLSKKEVQ